MRYQDISLESVKEALHLIDNGKTDREISQIIGLSHIFLGESGTKIIVRDLYNGKITNFLPNRKMT